VGLYKKNPKTIVFYCSQIMILSACGFGGCYKRSPIVEPPKLANASEFDFGKIALGIAIIVRFDVKTLHVVKIHKFSNIRVLFSFN